MRKLIECTINWIIGYVGVMVLAFMLGVIYGATVVFLDSLDETEQTQQY